MSKRLLMPLLVLAMVGAVNVVTKQAASAAVCGTPGMVYTAGGRNVVNEFAPINGSFYVVGFGLSTIGVTFGGNGLKKGTAPNWTVYSGNTGEFVGTLGGHTTSGNCVSNEILYSFVGSPGDTYVVKATYVTGNSDKTIIGQNHILVAFL